MDYPDLLSLFSSPYRIKLIQLLQQNDHSLSQLTEEIGTISNSEVSRHLARLMEYNVVTKSTFNKRDYTITTFGTLLVTYFEPLGFLLENGDYFSTHSLEGIPTELLSSIHTLKDARKIEGIGNVLKFINNIVSSVVEKHVFALIHDHLAFGNDIEILGKVILPKQLLSNVERLIAFKEHYPNLKLKNLELKVSQNFPLYMIIYDQGEIGVLAFPKIGENVPDLNTLFCIYNKKVSCHQFMMTLWQYHWDNAEKIDQKTLNGLKMLA